MVVVIALVTGLGVVFLYRHYNGNLNVARHRPRSWHEPAAPRSPQGSARPDQHPGHGLGQPRRPGRPHRQPDRHRQALRHHDPAAPLGRPAARLRRQHPARLGRQPRRLPDDNGQGDLAAPRPARCGTTRSTSAARPARSSSSSSSPASGSTTSSSSTSPASSRWSTRSAASRCACRTPVNDPIGHITLPAGTHKFSGTQALNYVRERHVARQRLRHRPDEAAAGVHRLDGAPGGQRRHAGQPDPPGQVPRRGDQVADRSTRA